jgi:hypothetical protein
MGYVLHVLKSIEDRAGAGGYHGGHG